MNAGTEGLLTEVACAGVPITACRRDTAASELVRIATSEDNHRTDVHLCNAYTLALADMEPRFKAMLQAASINFPDGKSVVWANRLSHRDKDLPNNRVYGPDLFLDVFALGQDLGLRHYLLGSTPAVLASLTDELRRRFADVQIVGVESPPFRTLTEDEYRNQVERILSSKAQIVWIGLGTPKQDWEAARLAAGVPAVCCAVGAAFDFVAGTKEQAPLWMRERGGEWFYRLATEPGRLWKRYLFGNPRFVLAAIRGHKAQGQLRTEHGRDVA